MATEKVKVYEEQEKKKGLSMWAWLLPLLLLLLLGIWLFNRSRHDAAPATTAAVADQTKPDNTAGTTPQAQAWTAASIADTIRQSGRVGFTDNEVHFSTASAGLAGDSQAVLDQTAQALQQNGDWKMRVVGHTDSVGTPQANDQLAQQRAQSVMAYLVAHGVAAGRLRVEAEGQHQPVATNATDQGRAENRRVELIKD